MDGTKLSSATESQIPPPSEENDFYEEEVAVLSKKKMAPCWLHAKKIIRKNRKGEIVGIFAVCNHCKIYVAAHAKKHGNNGINNHLTKCKLNPQNAVNSDSSQPILTQLSMNNALTPHTFNQKRLEEKVGEFVIRDEMAFRVVEGIGFVRMMNEAEPRFKIPNKKKVAYLVWDLYAMEMIKIKSVLGNQRVSITTDTWTSLQNINYMVITAHFIDDDWKLHKRIINFTKITSHKGDDIGKVMESCLNEWGIDKLFTITVDNASSNDTPIEYMGKRLHDIGTLLFDGKYLHLRCTCYIINLIVKSGLKQINASVVSIRNCVKYIHSSGARLDQFRDCAILLKMDKISTVPMDVSTRWNSTYLMLSVAYKFRKVFGRMAQNVQFIDYFNEKLDSGKRIGPPSDGDWEKAYVFVQFLKRFHLTTLKLSTSKTVTSTLVWEEIGSIGTCIKEALVDTTNIILNEIAENMNKKFQKYWANLEKVDKLVFLGQILDPRFKFQMLNIQLGDLKVGSAKIPSLVNGVKDCMMELYSAYKGSSSLVPLRSDNEGDVDNDLVELFKDDPIKLKHLLRMTQLRKAQKQMEITDEVDKYLADPFVQWTQNFNILEWWKGNAMTFPILSKVAKDIFAVPSSTVASENAFSLGGRIVNTFRASLHPKMVEALVCTSDWLRGEEINLYKEPTEEELEFYKDYEEVVTNTTTQGMGHPRV